MILIDKDDFDLATALGWRIDVCIDLNFKVRFSFQDMRRYESQDVLNVLTHILRTERSCMSSTVVSLVNADLSAHSPHMKSFMSLMHLI